MMGVHTIGPYAFANSHVRATHYSVERGFRWPHLATTINEGTFYGCRLLYAVDEKSLSVVDAIHAYAFAMSKQEEIMTHEPRSSLTIVNEFVTTRAAIRCG